MANDIIRYDILTQEALRRVIRKVLEEVSRTGLPGEHHFFITFETGFPGVRLSNRMRERYPEEMTIVVQHTFWNLEVDENAFEIDLSFDDIRERLRIPFSAIRGFFDPSVKFGLQFDVELPAATKETASETEKPVPTDKLPVRPKSSGKATTAKAGKKGDDKPKQEGTGDVVSLDSFRKKK